MKNKRKGKIIKTIYLEESEVRLMQDYYNNNMLSMLGALFLDVIERGDIE